MVDDSLGLAIKARSEALGFQLVGFTPATSHPDYDFYQKWLAKGYHGTMDWLARDPERRSDPCHLLPGARSLICCGLPYYTGTMASHEAERDGHGWISCYAWGDDYHEIMGRKLAALRSFIIDLIPHVRIRPYVDTGAILERSYAQAAGLGWIGKNTCLINQEIGSYFFIGVLITNLDLVPDRADTDHCGTCTRCLDACPTGALMPYELDARKCLSYLTIEHRGEIDPALQVKLGHHLFGCDICQEVCPWNRDPPQAMEQGFRAREGLFNPKLASLRGLEADSFAQRFKNSPIKRTKLAGLKRNLTIVETNQHNPKPTGTSRGHR